MDRSYIVLFLIIAALWLSYFLILILLMPIERAIIVFIFWAIATLIIVYTSRNK